MGALMFTTSARSRTFWQMAEPDAITTAAVAASVDAVLTMASAVPGPVIVVRSAPGGAAGPVVEQAAPRLEARGGTVTAVPALEDLDDAGLLRLRRRIPDATILAATEVATDGTAVATLLQYLEPQVHDVAPLSIGQVGRVLEAAGLGAAGDVGAAQVRRWTSGLAGDVADVARHLTALPDPTIPWSGEALIGFGPAAARRAAWRDPAGAALWALATVAGLDAPGPEGLGLKRPGPDARTVDAHACVASLPADERRRALETAVDLAAQHPATDLAPEALLAVGSWWCELDGSPLRAEELGHLAAAVQLAFRRNRFSAALPMADRLWRTTHAELAGVALAAALSRSTPDDPRAAALEVLASLPSPDVGAAVRVTQATWLFHLDHRPDDALALLGPRPEPNPGSASTDPRHGQREANVRDALATLELHLGRPAAVQQRLTEAGADGEAARSDGAPTAFGVNALVLADLVRGRHRSAADRLDHELERRLDPGPNLSVDRYRFYRAIAAAQAGWPESAAVADLDLAYEQALVDADDWTLGWIGWGAGVQAARAGRFRTARRRLGAATGAFTRAHRPGFAMWPQAARLELDALTDPGFVRVDHAIAFDHAVVAERAAAKFALAVAARAAAAPMAEVGRLLQDAMRTARASEEVVTSYLVAIERLLAGLDLEHPIADPAADGVLVDVWPLVASGEASDWDAAGARLAAAGWAVLGVRLRGAAASRIRRAEPRVATRIRHEVRAVTATFEGVLQPWALEPEDLPTLSSRELEVARAIAAGAGRDELATRLVVSRRTIDSHLQRVYSKLGITSRAELRAWLDGA